MNAAPTVRKGSFLALALLPFAAVLLAAEGGVPPAAGPPAPPAPAPISATEPLAPRFSLESAAGALDTASLHWQATRQCATCHTNFAYLIGRQALAPVSPPRPEVRAFIEEMVEKTWEKDGPRWDAEVVCAATTLSFNDRATTGRLSPAARKAFDRMLKLQRDDGGWTWLKCGWPPMESDDHYGVTFAALGIGLAPEGFAASEPGKKALGGIRRYLAANPAPSLHHRAMILWASLHVSGLLGEAERKAVLDDLFRLQLPDGGWAVAALFDGWKDHQRKDSTAQDTRTSDGYATGFAVYVAREAGISAGDPRLQRAVGWLKSHQRASGRWFTRSPTKDSQHFLSNAGTAFAAMALAACGEVPGASQGLRRRF